MDISFIIYSPHGYRIDEEKLRAGKIPSVRRLVNLAKRGAYKLNN